MTEAADGEPFRPAVIVISGPGGVGKGTLVERLVAADHNLWLSRSWTTRERRPGERPDAYVFVSRQEFLDRVEAGGFLEWIEFLDYLQGTPVPEPPVGHDLVFEIDVEGARAIRAWRPDAAVVFVDTPDRAVQEARLRGRGDPEETVQRRLAKGDEERAQVVEIDHDVVVNDDLDRALVELQAVVARVRASARAAD